MKESRFDIVVVGGGCAGVAAAISSARGGKRVLLIDKNKHIGGLAANAEVGTICGLYMNDDSESFNFNVSEFTRNFAKEVQNRSNSKPIKEASGLKFLPFIPNMFRDYCEELLSQNDVVYQCNAELKEVLVEKEEIKEVRICIDGGMEIFTVKAIVDASGLSIVSKLLGHNMINTVLKQTASQVFTIRGLKYENQVNLSLILLTALRKGVMTETLTDGEDRIYIIPGSLQNGKVSLKLTIPMEVSLLNDNLEELKASGSSVIEKIIHYLKKNVNGFLDIELESKASELGVRIDDRPVGIKILTEKDVSGGIKTKEWIAKGNWPMEIWSHAKRVEIRPIVENDFYAISADCLVSPKVSNLFFGGRAISATDEAIASARVIGTCLQTGYAAGMLAVGKTNNKDMNETIRKIQKEQFGE